MPYYPQFEYIHPKIFMESMQRFRPSDWDVFTSAIKQGFEYTPMVSLGKWLEYKFAGDELFSGPQAKSVSEIAFDNAIGNRDLKWHEGISIKQTELLIETYDRDEAQAWFLKNVGVWEPWRIGGFLLGSIPDPLNLIPFGGAVTRLGQTAKLMKMGVGGRIANIADKVGSGIIKPGMEASFYAGMADLLLIPKRSLYQQEYHWQDVATNIAFAFGAGSTLGGFLTVGKTLKDFSGQFKLGALTKAADDLAQETHSVNVSTEITGYGPNLRDTKGQFAKNPKRFVMLGEAYETPHPESIDPFQWVGARHPEDAVPSQTIFDSINDFFNRMKERAVKEWNAAKTDQTVKTVSDSVEKGAGTLEKAVHDIFDLDDLSLNKLMQDAQNCIKGGFK